MFYHYTACVLVVRLFMLVEEICKQVSWNQRPDDDASDQDVGKEHVDVTGANEGAGMGHEEEGGVDDQDNA